MKALILSLCLFATLNATAQTILFSEDFENTSGTSLPPGWTNTSTDVPGWVTSTAATINSVNYNVPGHTRFAVVNDDRFLTNLPGRNNLNDQLTMPSVNLSSATVPFLQFNQFFAGQAESATVQVSVNGGMTWVTIDSLNLTGYPLSWSQRQISLQQFAGMSNVKIRFGYSDLGNWADGTAIDDVQIFQPPNNDVAIDSIMLRSIIPNNTPLRVAVSSHCAQTIQTLALSYTINGGTPVVQNFSGLSIAPYTGGSVTFSPNIDNLPLHQAYTVTVNVISINGSPDLNPSNNQSTKHFSIASEAVKRSVLFELSTSSTCPPCAGFGDHYDPIWLSMGANNPDSNFNVIKYQQNFPAPYDSSFNTDAQKRMQYYYGGGIPSPTVDGYYGTDEAVIAHKAENAYVSLSGSYVYKADKDSAYMTVVVTPHFTGYGNYRLRLALTENHYQNPHNLNGELDYYDVERNMLPDANGTTIDTFIDGETKTFTFKTDIHSGPVFKNTHTFWGDPHNSHAVAFIQDDDTKEVLQSISMLPNGTTAIGQVGAVKDVSIYPEPANALAYVAFYLSKSDNISFRLTDITGRILYNDTQTFGSGRNTARMETSAFPDGLYMITIATSEGAITKKINIRH